MVHGQKPGFVYRRKGRVHLNRLGTSVQSTTGSQAVRINGSNTGYTMFRGSVKSAGYPLHSPVFPSLLLPRVTVCQNISTYCTGGRMDSKDCPGGFEKRKFLPHTGVRKRNLPARSERSTGYTIPR